jgi:hypothetical protein
VVRPHQPTRDRRGSFRSVRDLVRKFDSYVTQCNTSQRPFTWNATRDSILDKIQRLCKVNNGTAHQARRTWRDSLIRQRFSRDYSTAAFTGSASADYSSRRAQLYRRNGIRVRRSVPSKSGHMRRLNTSSAWAHSQSKKSDSRFSPAA